MGTGATAPPGAAQGGCHGAAQPFHDVGDNPGNKGPQPVGEPGRDPSLDTQQGGSQLSTGVDGVDGGRVREQFSEPVAGQGIALQTLQGGGGEEPAGTVEPVDRPQNRGAWSATRPIVTASTATTQAASCWLRGRAGSA